MLKGVDLGIRPGETVGLAGESGSGKTTIGRAILGLVPVASGTITFDGERVDTASAARRRASSRAASDSGSPSPGPWHCGPVSSSDEPVSALDLTTQATVLELLLDIQEESGVAYLFVSHDLSVVRFMSHRVCVIHRGEIVESGDADTLTRTPEHPYTRTLLLSAPIADVTGQRRRREQRAALAQAG